MDKRLFEKWRRSESGQYLHLEKGEVCKYCKAPHTLNREVEWVTSLIGQAVLIMAQEDIELYEKKR